MQKTLITVVAAVALTAQMALAQPAPAPAAPAVEQAPAAPAIAPIATRPNTAIIPNLNPGFRRAHTNFVEIAKKGDIDVLFMGDSITDWWRNPGRAQGTNGVLAAGGKAVFDKYFGSMKVANFGIAGDTTQGVLWRLQNGEGEGYKPKAIMLMIGTNNGNPAPEVAMGVAAIVAELRKDFPDAKILLLAIFPRAGANSGLRIKNTEVNKIISALNDDRHVFFMDIGPKFLAEDGSIPRDIMGDSLHPTNKGYEIWAEAVKDKLASLMQ